MSLEGGQRTATPEPLGPPVATGEGIGKVFVAHPTLERIGPGRRRRTPRPPGHHVTTSGAVFVEITPPGPTRAPRSPGSAALRIDRTEWWRSATTRTTCPCSSGRDGASRWRTRSDGEGRGRRDDRQQRRLRVARVIESILGS
ncbi:MAG: hypothetical protein R2695_02410 [Acidimicrobiales bacterium]